MGWLKEFESGSSVPLNSSFIEDGGYINSRISFLNTNKRMIMIIIIITIITVSNVLFFDAFGISPIYIYPQTRTRYTNGQQCAQVFGGSSVQRVQGGVAK